MSIANAAGATVRADINSALQALVSLSAGATEPATMYAYQLWYDTTANVLKIRNAANSAWVIVDSPVSTTERGIWLNGTQRVTVKSGGVGIDQTTPAHALDVDGDINVTGDFMINGVPLSFTIGANSVTWGQLEQAAANTVICRPSLTDGDVSEVAIAASRLFGRGATGNVGPITLGTGLVFSGAALNIDVGSTANKIVQLDGSARLPAVDGSQLTNVPLGVVTYLAVGTYVMAHNNSGSPVSPGATMTSNGSNMRTFTTSEGVSSNIPNGYVMRCMGGIPFSSNQGALWVRVS